MGGSDVIKDTEMRVSVEASTPTGYYIIRGSSSAGDVTIGRVGRAARHVGVMQVRVFVGRMAAGQAVGRVVGLLSAVAWQTRPDTHPPTRESELGGSMGLYCRRG